MIYDCFKGQAIKTEANFICPLASRTLVFSFVLNLIKYLLGLLLSLYVENG